MTPLGNPRPLGRDQRHTIVKLVRKPCRDHNNNLMSDLTFPLEREALAWRSVWIRVGRRSGGGMVPVHLAMLWHAWENNPPNGEGAVKQLLDGVAALA